jgi:tetratricopeptide (TPR) repeat protein
MDETNNKIDLQKFIDEHNTDISLAKLNDLINARENPLDQFYYLRGDIYRKKGDWQHAISSYLYAIEINPESPAVEAYKMAMEILEFYNKDMYNQ